MGKGVIDRESRGMEGERVSVSGQVNDFGIWGEEWEEISSSWWGGYEREGVIDREGECLGR